MRLFPVRQRARRLAAILGGIAIVTGAAVCVPAVASSAAGSPVTHASTATSALTDHSTWVASWAASPMSGTTPTGTTSFSDQTVRNIIYTSAGGDSLRIRVSNTFGTQPVTIGDVSVGVVLDGAQLVPGTNRTVTFAGRPSATIPAGSQLLSDPVAMTVRPLTELAVSVYLPSATGPATNHSDAQQTNYIASGDHAGDAAATAYTGTTGSWYFVDGVDVRSPAADGTIVAFGDSITDGYQSLAGANARWPNYLARRLQSVFGGRAPGVVDEGISGNRILSGSACYGVSAESRFERDALSQPGVKAVILLEGINDIGFSGEADSGCYTPVNSTVTAAQIEAGYRVLASEAHARGVRVYIGTLTPFANSNPGYGGNFGTAKGEALREQVNDWIVSNKVFDGVINFAKAVQDPYNPRYLNPVYNSGDSLHPGDVGYEAMADAIPLGFLR
ncbi:MAG TPA: SGNH/GDSL hydrolase family protein [Trebonia sp.]|nr:SGNH/GDSL hydrolase family protein [Trebonia sp.]